MVRIIGTLGKYDQRRLLILLIFFFFYHKNLTFHWIIIILKGAKIIMTNMFFSNTHWPQLMAPFYSILFETSIFQFNSSTFSPIMPDEVKEHLTMYHRSFLHPESLQISQIHSSMTVLLLFSSPRSFSTVFRSEDWTSHSKSMVLKHTFLCCFWVFFNLKCPVGRSKHGPLYDF